MAKAVLIHVSTGTYSGSSNWLIQRLKKLEEIASLMEFHLEVIDSHDLYQTRPGMGNIAEQLTQAQGIWWCGPLIFPKEANRLWSCLHQHLQALSSSIPAFDSPQDIEQCFNLAQSYAVLHKAGIPQAATQFIPFSEDESKLSPEELQDLVKQKLESVEMPAQFVFYRTFYGSEKNHTNFAFSSQQLIDGVVRIITSLRERQDIGGIAIREILRIKGVSDNNGRYFNKEFRVFIAWGKPLMWFCDYELSLLHPFVKSDVLKSLGKMTPEQFQQIYQFSQKIGSIFGARLVVADFAILKDGQVVLIETNAGHCSGLPHEVAYIGVYGCFLRKMLDLPLLSCEELIDIGNRSSIDLWGLGEVYYFYS